MTREEHLAWCKKRAHEYLSQGDVQNAIASMMSDLNKHPETAGINPAISMVGMMAAANHDIPGAKRFIDGFK